MPDRYSDQAKAVHNHNYAELSDILRAIQDFSSLLAATGSGIFGTRAPHGPPPVTPPRRRRRPRPQPVYQNGTTTISTETPRSESKSPEITITPGSEVGADEFDGAGRDPDRDRDPDRLTVPQPHQRYHEHHHRHHHSHSHREEKDGTRYVHIEGPLDGALYAIVNPVTKVVDAPSSADSGISVSHIDQMKDLDRLLNALVQDAESIPDIPYHAREDSLPFSYGMPDRATLQQRQELEERLASRRQQGEQHERERERERQYQNPVAVGAAGVGSGQVQAPFSYTAQRSISPSSRIYAPPPMYSAPPTAPSRQQQRVQQQQRPTPTGGLPSHYSSSGSSRPTHTPGVSVPDSTEFIDKIRQVQQEQQRPHGHGHQTQPRYLSTQLLRRAAEAPPAPHGYSHTHARSVPHFQSQPQHYQPRTHHIQLELEDQIIPYSRERERERMTRHESPPRSTSSAATAYPYSRSLSSSHAVDRELDRQRDWDIYGERKAAADQQIYYPSVQSEPGGGGGERVYRFYSSTPQQQQQYQERSQPPAYQQPPPPTSFSFDNFGRAIEGVEQRIRSQSAEGRRFTPLGVRDENADEWLRRQKQRLEEKRSASQTPMRQDWLYELKSGLPSRDIDQPDVGPVKPSNYSSITRFTPSGQPRTTRSSASTPVAGLYSSDDESSEFDREVEREMFNRDYTGSGRRDPRRGFGLGRGGGGGGIQRYHSESAYDRAAAARASSQQSSYGSTSGVESSATTTTTPGFPICPPTPYLNRPSSPSPAYKPPRSPKAGRKPTGGGGSAATTAEWTSTQTPTSTPGSMFQDYGSMSMLDRGSRAQTPVNPRPVHLGESEVKFARDQSHYWYKPNAAREETISALRYQPSGSFIIRNSNSFPGAYGLAIKVNDGLTTEDSVRHFLIEPTKYGVRLRGSAVEPVFGSLSALVYAHSIEPLALPTTLTLPAGDTVLPSSQAQSTTAHLLTQGAACQLLFIGVAGVELITGDDAIKRGIGAVVGVSTPTVVSLRLSKHGLTLTDILRQRFFRLHFPLDGISYAAVDPANKSITYRNASRKIFAVIARAPSALENSCVVLAELEEGQPANAIVAFIQRVIAWQS